MALLCHHSNQKWVCLVDSAVAALDWTLEHFFSPGKKSSKGKSKSSSITMVCTAMLWGFALQD